MPKAVWEQAASPPLVADPPTAAAHDRSTVFSRWRQCTRYISNILFLGPNQLIIPNDTSIGSEAVFHISMYVMRRPLPPPKKNAPYRGELNRNVTAGSADSPDPPPPNGISILSNVFFRIHGRYQRTDKDGIRPVRRNWLN